MTAWEASEAEMEQW